MHFVTLTSDWNKDDFYSGSVKGRILSECDNTQVVTLTNRVKPYNISEAAFIIRNVFHHYPGGTIHLVAVNARPSKETRMIAAKISGHYFLSADNGLFGLLGDLEPEKMVVLEEPESSSSSFVALDILAPAACRILKGESLEKIGTPLKDLMKQTPLRATLENNTITGTVIHLDSYGNAITNITQELFDRIGSRRSFEILVQSKYYKISTLSNYYADVEPGDLVAIFNSLGLLEIAIRNGSAAGLLNLNTDSTVRVEFK